jgi:hypothetical protein
MAINHAVQTDTVQRFLLISELFLLSQATSEQSPRQAKCCVPSLRTCVPLELTSEWVDPIKYRIDLHASSCRVVVHQGSAQ